MRVRVALIALFVLFGCLSFTSAQNLNSKARVAAFAKLPDWSGMWEPDTFVGQADGQQFSEEALRKMKERAQAMRPSFTPEYQAKYEQIKKPIEAAIAADPAHPPATHHPLCGAPPFPATFTPGMFEWRVTPEETTFISTVGAVRHIYTDGRSHPPQDEMWPTLMGDSIGHWEGETLVVDTIGTRPRLYMGELTGFFVPMSDQLHFTERIRIVNHDSMQIEYTVEDPLALTKPIHVVFTYVRVTDFNRMLEEADCEENERDPVVNGRFTTVTH
jgi:hypothetical protein